MTSMSGEMLLVIATIVLGFVHIILQIRAVTRQRGVKWNMGPRDEEFGPPSGAAGRLDRALKNFKETFPLFLGAVFVAQVSARTGGLSLLGAHLYFWCRLVYLPLYVRGVTGWRTAAWTGSAIGISLILVAALTGL